MSDRVALDGRVALAAGGTKGIGRAIAATLAASGAVTTLCGRDAGLARQVAAELGMSTRSTVHGFGADLTDEAEVDRLLAGVTEAVGAVDILVASVGGFERTFPVWETPLDEWNDLLRLNMTATFLLTRAVVRGMVERRWGRLVFVGSPAGREVGYGGSVAYCAAKMGLIGFANSLVWDLAPHGVTVNVVVPGATLSERFVRLSANRGGVGAVAKTVPVGRVADPEEIAGVVPFLVSDLGGYTTGAVIDIHGGGRW